MKTTRIKGIRLSNEVADFYDDLPLRSILVNLKGQIERNEVSINGGFISVNTLSDSVNTAEIKESQSKIVEFNSVNTLSRSVNRAVGDDLFIGDYAEEALSDDAQYAIKDLIGMIRATYDENQNQGDADEFFTDLHDKIESGEWKIKDSKLKLGFSDVFKVLNTSEVKKWLKPVWNACEEKGRPYTDGLRAVFKHGAKLATEDLYGDRQ